MKLLREYICETLDQQNGLMIPPPPSEQRRVEELFVIQKQYYGRHNRESIQGILDDVVKTFDIVMSAKGIRGQKNLIAQLKEEIVPVILIHKEYFNSPRPKELAVQKNIDFISDDLESANSPSYPSGHTAQAYYIALELSKIYPSLREALMGLANMISQARVDRGVHFPSDIEAGKSLGIKLSRRKTFDSQMVEYL